MMIFKRLHFYKIVSLLFFVGCSSGYIITDLDGRKINATGKIQNKILFKTEHGFPVNFKPQGIDSLYINPRRIVTIGNDIFYESTVKLADGEIIKGFISADNSFEGENKNLAFEVAFSKIATIQKVK